MNIRIEYVKVDVYQVMDQLFAGNKINIYIHKEEGICNDAGYFKIERLTAEALRSNSGNLFRKVETPVEWWEDVVDYVKSINGSAKGILVSDGNLSIDTTMTKDQWCDFARILLEQND